MGPKEDILNSAIELFAKRGFEGVSIREIAEHANVHFASIRYHFGSKEDLYSSCISKHGESRLISAQHFLNPEPKTISDMKLQLTQAIEDVFRIHSENPFLTKLLLQEIESSDQQSDAVLKKTMVAMSETYALFFKICQEKNFLDKTLSPIFLTQSLMGILHHFMRTETIRERLLSHRKLNNNEQKELLIEQIVTLIIGKI